LVELKLSDCQLSYESFEWLLTRSLETLKTLEVLNTSVWKDIFITPMPSVTSAKEIQKHERGMERDQRFLVAGLDSKHGIEAMEKRLGVDLPIFEMRRKS
jgi:hypothetical protein